jgi:tetratricopeptide (TPR) repeat protein
VLLRTAGLSGQARAAAEAAAVTGPRFEIGLVAALGGTEGLEELAASGMIVEAGGDRAAFRHPLARDAIYEDIPWLRRRSLHRGLAERREGRPGKSSEVAAHWLAAREPARALDALVCAIRELMAVHAYRDAARAGRQALELWPDRERSADRVAMLEQHARCCELAGELTEAARALREVAAAHRTHGGGRALADAERRLACIFELQSDRKRALAARRVAADVFAANRLPGEAAAERLIAAGYLQSAGKHTEAVELAGRAVEEAARAELCRDVQRRAGGAELVADGVLGAIHAFRGDTSAARPLLLRGLNAAYRLDVVSMQVDCAAALAWVEHHEGASDAAAGRCRFVLARPRDRTRAVPQPANRRHARPQHPRQARLPHAHGGHVESERARAARGLTSAPMLARRRLRE